MEKRRVSSFGCDDNNSTKMTHPEMAEQFLSGAQNADLIQCTDQALKSYDQQID